MAAEGDDAVAEEPQAKRARVESPTDLYDQKFTFTHDEREFELRLSRTDSVESVKAEIESQFGLSIDNINLVCKHRSLLDSGHFHFESHLLDDDEPIWQDDRVEGDTIEVFVQQNEPAFQIFVRDLTNTVVTFRVNPRDSVEWLKFLIFRKQDICVHQQRLIFAGKQMEDDRPLENYRVERESTIHLVLRLCGS